MPTAGTATTPRGFLRNLMATAGGRPSAGPDLPPSAARSVTPSRLPPPPRLIPPGPHRPPPNWHKSPPRGNCSRRPPGPAAPRRRKREARPPSDRDAIADIIELLQGDRERAAAFYRAHPGVCLGGLCKRPAELEVERPRASAE